MLSIFGEIGVGRILLAGAASAVTALVIAWVLIAWLFHDYQRLGKKVDARIGLLGLVQTLEFVSGSDRELEQTVRRILAASSINFPETATRLEADPPVSCAAFSRDGQLLFTGCDDGTVRVFDPATCRLSMEIPLFEKELAKPIFKVAIQSNGSALLAWNGKEARVPTWLSRGLRTGIHCNVRSHAFNTG